MKAKHDLEHHVWDLLKRYDLKEKHLLVALSGGVDSVALLRVLQRVFSGPITAAYFHHGEAANRSYRDQALSFCESLCRDLNVSFRALRATQNVSSEQEYRDLRYQALEACRLELGAEVVVVAHHRDDLLETRLMRLIRGTGVQGFEAMQVFKAPYFRPFLQISKQSLIEYVERQELKFLEDPTNLELDPFRNWIRQEWLPQLETRQKGAVASLARSLETIVEEIGKDCGGEEQEFSQQVSSSALSRSFYLTLSESLQRRALARFLYHKGKRDFSRSHIEEIQKRLDKSQKVITFKVGGCLWHVNAEQIEVQILE